MPNLTICLLEDTSRERFDQIVKQLNDAGATAVHPHAYINTISLSTDLTESELRALVPETESVSLQKVMRTTNF